MKKILITGANSYIGTSFEKWVSQWPDKYSVETIDMVRPAWREKSFDGYDAVFHVAGIAHVSTKTKMQNMYYKVNRDLAAETAQRAKAGGVKQFIFMSSIIIYGESGPINRRKIITPNTAPEPSSLYGRSKLQAEDTIRPLGCHHFKVVILRPPMIYGSGCKGNYQKLSACARRLHFFPDIDNQRSMLHIDNLCEFVRLMIDNDESGVFFPQNAEYIRTSEMVGLIAEAHGRKIKFTKVFNPLLRLAGRFCGSVNKAFGNLVYERSMSEYKENYRIRNLRESIAMSEELGQGNGNDMAAPK